MKVLKDSTYTPISSIKNSSIISCAMLLSISSLTAYADDSTVINSDLEIEKGYILTPVDTASENTITKYEINTETGKLEPKYYDVDLAKTEYGSGSENTLYYNWEKDSSGNYILKEDISATSGNSIIYNYDSSDSLSRKMNPTGDVIGNFIKNNIISDSSSAYGGAIYNDGTIGNIAGNFIGNYASSSYPISTSSSSYSASGGAIFNSGSIVNITGDFVGNYISGYGACGAAISNDNGGTIVNITGDFIGNYAISFSNYFPRGGAIYNNALLGSIAGDFIGNYALSSDSSFAYGGAIYNSSRIENITGDFIGNYAESSSSYAKGGAISNSGTIGNITGDFIGNYASSGSREASGGAIYNSGSSAEIGNITGDFINNQAPLGGGAIYNLGTINNITGDFINNQAENGGAIYNLGTISNIIGDFIANNTISSSTNQGAAIYNSGTIDNIRGNFIGNYSQYYGGGAIGNAGVIDNIASNFIGNYAYDSKRYCSGGAIYNMTSIKNIAGDFIGNYAKSSAGYASGGAIYNNGTVGDITGDFIGNYAKPSSSSAFGGAIYNQGAIGDITGDFIENYAESSSSVAGGGAIFNTGTIGEKDSEGNLAGGISGSFINNYAKTESSSDLALGGAVYTNHDINFIADGKNIEFTGNYTEDYRGKINNAIFVDTSYSSPTISLKAENNGTITFNDQIDGGNISGTNIDRTNKYNLNLTGDKSGKIQLNDKVINANATLDEVTLHLTKADILDSSVLNVNSGHLSLMNGIAETQVMQGMNINGHLGMSVDVDLASAKMDRLPENVVVSKDAQIDVEHLNLLNDSTADKTDIQFADSTYSNQVAYTGENPVAYSPIYKYDVSYNKDDGFFTFLRHGATTGNSSENFNPTVLAPSVAAQAGGYATQMQTFNYAFQHADNFMNIPYLERIAIKESGRYAMSPTGDATDIGVFSPLMTRVENAGYWIKPYVSFENIPLKNGPKVNNITYGSLIGYDSNLTPIAHGFDRVLTGYIGYNGASQSYSGVDSYQNGGLLGGTLTLYKGNFFNATTISAGASVGESHNMYGTDNYTMLLAGIGNKLGYNFEFKNGRFIVQPAMLVSYTFVNTFDYANAAGVRIDSDPLHAIQLSPGVKFIMNTKNGWQPYAAVNMVWNILDKQNVMANDVRIPEMSIKPYVQYGVGVQKRIKDRFLAFGQALISNGGRNGISLSFGLRWFLGK